MDRVHARYPFLDGARDAVSSSGIDLRRVIDEESAIIDRALDRVRTAIEDGTIGDAHPDTRVEVLSYPVARILVSAVDETVLVRRYARAEAETAFERILEDQSETNELACLESAELAIDDLIAEFEFDDAIRQTDESMWLNIGRYLPLTDELHKTKWKLVNRTVSNGEVKLSEAEFLQLTREAIRQRIVDDLPLEVPDAIASLLTDEIFALREELLALDRQSQIDVVDLDQVPPCISALRDQLRAGEKLDEQSRFVLTSFLASIGMDSSEIVSVYDSGDAIDERVVEDEAAHICGGNSPTEFSPPSCETMQASGLCVAMDELCDRIPHPLTYYEHRIGESTAADLRMGES